MLNGERSASSPVREERAPEVLRGVRPEGTPRLGESRDLARGRAAERAAQDQVACGAGVRVAQPAHGDDLDGPGADAADRGELGAREFRIAVRPEVESRGERGRERPQGRGACARDAAPGAERLWGVRGVCRGVGGRQELWRPDRNAGSGRADRNAGMGRADESSQPVRPASITRAGTFAGSGPGEARGQPPLEGARGRERDLLTQHDPERELRRVSRARHPQTGPTGDKGREPWVTAEHRRYPSGLGIKVEEPAQGSNGVAGVRTAVRAGGRGEVEQDRDPEARLRVGSGGHPVEPGHGRAGGNADRVLGGGDRAVRFARPDEPVPARDRVGHERGERAGHVVGRVCPEAPHETDHSARITGRSWRTSRTGDTSRTGHTSNTGNTRRTGRSWRTWIGLPLASSAVLRGPEAREVRLDPDPRACHAPILPRGSSADYPGLTPAPAPAPRARPPHQPPRPTPPGPRPPPGTPHAPAASVSRTLGAMSDASGRQALLRATIVVVAGGGLRALTYRAVAAEAGVSHGLVRHHFGTRDQLIAEAMEFAIGESLRGSNMLEQGLTAQEFAAGVESLADRDSELQSFQYELLLETRRRPELRHLAERHYGAYREAIDRQLGRLGVADAGLTELIWFALDGIVFKQLVDPADPGAALARIRALIEESARG